MAKISRKRKAKPDTNLAGSPAVASHAYKRIDQMTMMGLIVPKMLKVAGLLEKLVGMLKVRDLGDKDSPLSDRGASYQAGHGVRGKTQAAHNLPRDLLIDGRPFWTYARDKRVLDAHARVLVQIDYSAAATVTVPLESNYIDSRWEESGLVKHWLGYLRTCIENAKKLGDGGALDKGIASAADDFKAQCWDTLGHTYNRILDSDYYDDHGVALESYFVIYRKKLRDYDPARRLSRMWAIYQLPQYR